MVYTYKVTGIGLLSLLSHSAVATTPYHSPSHTPLHHYYTTILPYTIITHFTVTIIIIQLSNEIIDKWIPCYLFISFHSSRPYWDFLDLPIANMGAAVDHVHICVILSVRSLFIIIFTNYHLAYC